MSPVESARAWLAAQNEKMPPCADCDGHGRRDCERCGAFVDDRGPQIVQALLDHIATITPSVAK